MALIGMPAEPQHLPAILRSLHPWLRARVTSIGIAPAVADGWDATLARHFRWFAVPL